MPKSWFTLVLDGVDVITPELAEAIFEAGCRDATPGSSGGVVMVDFARVAPSFPDAVGSAIRNVARAGYEVARMEVEEEPPPFAASS